MSGTYYLKLAHGMGFKTIGKIKSVTLENGDTFFVDGEALAKDNTLLTYGNVKSKITV